MQCVYWKLILAHTKNCTAAENSAMGWWLLSKQLCWHTGALDFMRGTLRPCMCKCRWGAHHLGNKRHSQRCLPSSCVQLLWKQRTGKKIRTVRKQHLWDPRRPVLCVDVGPSPRPQFLSVHFLSFSSVMGKGLERCFCTRVCSQPQYH